MTEVYTLSTAQEQQLVGPNLNGLFEDSKGGTETMFRKLHEHVDSDLLDNFQIICSRFRGLQEGKIPILWLHDRYNDPEVSFLSDPANRARFSKLVFVSYDQFAKYNAALGVPYDNSIVLKNAIETFDMTDAELQSKVIGEDNQLRMIYHTTPHRGLDILLGVFPYIIDVFPDLDIHLDVFSSFNLYGEQFAIKDQMFEPLYKFCREHPNITYHGVQPNNVVRDYLRRAHLFAYPSTWEETSCIAAIEALNSGTVVLVSDLGALPETVSQYGYVYRYTEVTDIHAYRFFEGLKRVINELISSEENLIISKAKAAITWSNAMYDWKYRGKQWEIFLDGEKKKKDTASV